MSENDQVRNRKKVNPPDQSTILNVCIVPDDRVARTYVEISRSLESPDTLFVLGENKFAHMTAFMARFADSSIESVVARVEQSLDQISRFQCEHTGYLITQGRYLEASYRKSAGLVGLHESLAVSLSPLRLNPGNPFEEGYFSPFTPQQRKNAQETGYDLAHELFRPHVTLTRYREDGVPTFFPSLPRCELSFQARQVCVYKADNDGAVYQLVRPIVI